MGTNRWVCRSMSAVAVCCVLGLAGLARGQSDGALPVPYDLTEKSTYQTGCFPPCKCPITPELPVRGAFRLTPKGADPLFTHYAVTDVRWEVMLSTGPLPIVGSGTYKVGGEVAFTQQLVLDLRVGANPAQRFDSGLVPGGGTFPEIHVPISIHGMQCEDTAIRVHARPLPPPPPLPRHASFVLDPRQSGAELSLLAGGGRSPLAGAVRLYLGDPDVPVITLAGMVGLSVDGAELVAPDFTPDIPGVREPLQLIQNPAVRSVGSWNTITGQIHLELALVAPGGNLPVPMPLRLSGTLVGPALHIAGDNGNVVNARMAVNIVAREVPLPPPAVDIWFSTKSGFTAGAIQPAADAPVRVSDGDLLSRRGYVVRTNRQLTARLGIMPIVPDLGLDAVTHAPGGGFWFSFRGEQRPIWSETLGVWLKHGDLLSDAGTVVRANEKLLGRFAPEPPVEDAGLDAVGLGPNGEILFSTETEFFSKALGVRVRPGDLLSERGWIVRSNPQLLANFRPVAVGDGPIREDYGLDAIVVRANREFWFSTAVGFVDARLGPIGDGDLLSTAGYVVARNLDLVKAFGPVEDLADFGLDAAMVVARPVRCDFDGDGDVDLTDFRAVQESFNGPNRFVNRALLGFSEFDADLDDDNDVDLADFRVFANCFNGPNQPAACL